MGGIGASSSFRGAAIAAGAAKSITRILNTITLNLDIEFLLRLLEMIWNIFNVLDKTKVPNQPTDYNWIHPDQYTPLHSVILVVNVTIKPDK
jgi:hypothetical protein